MRRSVLRIFCITSLMIFLQYISIFAQPEWSPPLMISDSAFGNFPQIIANGDTMHVVYENAIKLNSHTVILSYIRSTDAGISWSNPIIISDTSFNSEFPRIIRNENRIIVIWMNRYSEYYHYSDKITYNISDDEGESWGNPQCILDSGLTGITPFCASGDGQYIVITFSRQYHDPYNVNLYSIRSSDFGETWSDTTAILRNIVDVWSYSDQASNGEYVHLVIVCTINPDVPNPKLYYFRSIDSGIT